MLGVMAGFDQKDSCSGMYSAGTAGDNAPCAVFVSLVGIPRMLVILADMDKEDSCSGMLKACGSLYMAVNCSVLVCLRSAYADSSGRLLPVWFPYSALSVGSTVDTCSASFQGGFVVISHIFYVKVELWILVDSRFFLHTCPMRKWPRSLSFRQWHGYCWFADEIAPRAVFPSSLAAVHQVRRQIPVVVQRADSHGPCDHGDSTVAVH